MRIIALYRVACKIKHTVNVWFYTVIELLLGYLEIRSRAKVSVNSRDTFSNRFKD